MYLSLTFLFPISFSFEKAGRVSSLSNSRHISREHILNTRKLWSRDSADQEVHIIGNMGTGLGIYEYVLAEFVIGTIAERIVVHE